MDRRTRQRHARQELIGLWCVMLAGALALFVLTLVHGHWTNVVLSGLLVLSFGINLLVQIRRRI